MVHVAFQYVQCFFRSGIELRIELGFARNEAITRSSLRELAVMASFLTWVCGPHVCITPVNSCPANSGFPLLKSRQSGGTGPVATPGLHIGPYGPVSSLYRDLSSTGVFSPELHWRVMT